VTARLLAKEEKEEKEEVHLMFVPLGAAREGAEEEDLLRAFGRLLCLLLHTKARMQVKKKDYRMKNYSVIFWRRTCAENGSKK
jgi:hypothetical protein